MKHLNIVSLLSILAMTAAAQARAATPGPPDLTGFYVSAMAMGPPAVLSADGVTFVASGMPPFAKEEQATRMNCIPDTAFGYNPYGEQLVQTPNRLTWINQYNHIVRRIDIDRPRPRAIKPSYTGYSSGHWEEGVLIVETTTLNKIQVRGAPAWVSVQRIVERIRKLDDGGIERITRFEATLSDGKPNVLTTRALYKLDPTQHLSEFICEDAADRFGEVDQ